MGTKFATRGAVTLGYGALILEKSFRPPHSVSTKSKPNFIFDYNFKSVQISIKFGT